MKYRTLDSNGDYTFGKNRFEKKREAVAQAIKTRMYLLLGEWWENTDDGLPLFEQILGVFADDERLRAVDLIISERIAGTTGVTRLIGYESSFENRVYSATCVVDTIFGETSLTLKGDGTITEVGY
jgi:hypothetical protein